MNLHDQITDLAFEIKQLEKDQEKENCPFTERSLCKKRLELINLQEQQLREDELM